MPVRSTTWLRRAYAIPSRTFGISAETDSCYNRAKELGRTIARVYSGAGGSRVHYEGSFPTPSCRTRRPTVHRDVLGLF